MKKTTCLWMLLCCLVALNGIAAETQEKKPLAVPEEAIAAATTVENAFCYVAAHARDSVVLITNLQKVSNTQNDFSMMFPEEFFGEDFFPWPRRDNRRQRKDNQKPAPERIVPAATGSGAVISADGYVITNLHVIDRAEFLQVKMADGTVYDNKKEKDAVRVVGVDKESDIAVLQLANGKKKDFAFLTFADSTKVRAGQWSIAIGAPYGLEQSVTIGIVSQINRYGFGMTTFDNYIQTDASINSGNSGGPLLNIRGEIIGINEFIQTDGAGKGNIGLGFAICANLAKQVATELMEHGTVRRPYLGISMQDLTPQLKLQFGAQYGVLVAEVIKDSAAEKAGMKSGDVIVAIGKQTVRNSHELLLAVTHFRPGDVIPVEIIREDKKQTLQVKAGLRDLDGDKAKKDGDEKKDDSGSKDESALLEKLGIDIDVNEDGLVIVKSIRDDGAVAKADRDNGPTLQTGDAILEINRQAVHSVKDVKNALKKTRKNVVLILFQRTYRRNTVIRQYVAIPLQ